MPRLLISLERKFGSRLRDQKSSLIAEANLEFGFFYNQNGIEIGVPNQGLIVLRKVLRWSIGLILVKKLRFILIDDC